MNEFEAADFLRQFSFWERLSPSDKELVSSNLHPVHYDAGQSIHSGEMNCLGTIFVKKGILRIYLLSGDGKETTMYRLRDGEVCVLSASCMLSAITFDVQIDAETSCDAFLIPAAVFSSLMNRNIYVENFAYRLITERFSDVVSAMERMFFLSLKQRIAAFLIDESSAQHTDHLLLTKEQLARSIGSAREAVSRNLKLLSSEGCIKVSRGSIDLLDKGKLYRQLEG